MSNGVAALAPSLRVALQQHSAQLDLRPEATADVGFINALYADSRREELAPLPWPEQTKRDFLAAQCRLQADHYRQHYVGAEFLIIEQAADPIGRLYVHPTSHELRIMDIVLLHDYIGHGIGTTLVVAVQQQAAARGVSVTLHVEPANPAQRLYQRLGFSLIENRGVYDFLGWTPTAND